MSNIHRFKRYLPSFLIFIIFAALSLAFTQAWLATPPKFTPRTLHPAPAVQDSYDVIVVSDEPEGIAAAISAARNGAHTLLISERETVGGLMTAGMLNLIDIDRGHRLRITTRGIFMDFYRRVGSPFDIEDAVNAFEHMLAGEQRLSVVRPVADPYPLTNGNRVTGVRFIYQGRPLTVTARTVIDATPDGDIAAAAGAPFTFGQNDFGRENAMAATLMLHFRNVDWKGVCRTARKGTFGKARGLGNHRRGFARLFEAYKPRDPAMRLRGFNITRQRDGTVVINALLIYGLDPRDRDAMDNAYARAKAETRHVLAFLRRAFPGFENAVIAGYPEMLYVRESRHIRGEYVLDIADVMENRDFPDRIAIGAYPVDIQAARQDEFGFVIGNPLQYSIPFRCLVPQKVENIMVVGRAASFTSLAAGSARVIPTGMAAGEAAGVAAVYAMEHGLSPRDIARNPEGAHIKAVQQTLTAQGAHLQPFDLAPDFTRHPAYPAAREVMRLGLVSAGYKNDFDLDRPTTHLEFANVYHAALTRAQALGRLPASTALRYPMDVPAVPLTTAEAARMVLWINGTPSDVDTAWDLACERDLIPAALANKDKNTPLTRGDLYLFVASGLGG